MCFVMDAVEGKNKANHSDFFRHIFRFFVRIIQIFFPWRVAGLQGYVLFPDLFSFYDEIFMQNIDGYQEAKVGKQDKNNLRHIKDTVLDCRNKKTCNDY